MDKKSKDALIEGCKKAACVVTNAAMFFYVPWLWDDNSYFPADPVWVHITITMLCELDTMDRLNEKILLRTAGTTIGALSGVVMSYSGLNDFQRLIIVFVWISFLGYIEKRDPTRSYVWTIGTVTFGICTYLGRMGKVWTPWKRWWSIVLGTIITAVWLLLLPWLGVLPKNIIRDELGQLAKKVWQGTTSMIEDAIQNPGDSEAIKRLQDQQATVHGLLAKWPAQWKQYSYARNWINFQPKKRLPMEGLRLLLKSPLLELFNSASMAARLVHRAGGTSQDEHPGRCNEEDYGAFRRHLHDAVLMVTPAIQVVATKSAVAEVRQGAVDELNRAVLKIQDAKSAIESAKTMPSPHKAAFAAVLVDMATVCAKLEHSLSVDGSSVRQSGSTDPIQKLVDFECSLAKSI